MGSQAILTTLRVLVVVIALGVVGLGAWAQFIIHDIKVGGFAILDRAHLKSPDDDAEWRSFMQTVLNDKLRIWIAMIAGAFSTLATLLVILSVSLQRIRLPTAFLLPLELLSALSLAAAFGSTLSMAMHFPASLPKPPPSPLDSFAMLLPLSRAYAIASGTGMFINLTTTISFLIQTIHRLRDSKACSFEPTASALGMGHGYQVPTVHETQSGDEEKGLVGAGAEMGKSDSTKSGEVDGASWPLEEVKKVDAAHVRPHRPWSEMPKP